MCHAQFGCSNFPYSARKLHPGQRRCCMKCISTGKCIRVTWLLGILFCLNSVPHGIAAGEAEHDGRTARQKTAKENWRMVMTHTEALLALLDSADSERQLYKELARFGRLIEGDGRADDTRSAVLVAYVLGLHYLGDTRSGRRALERELKRCPELERVSPSRFSYLRQALEIKSYRTSFREALQASHDVAHTLAIRSAWQSASLKPRQRQDKSLMATSQNFGEKWLHIRMIRPFQRRVPRKPRPCALS